MKKVSICTSSALPPYLAFDLRPYLQIESPMMLPMADCEEGIKVDLGREEEQRVEEQRD